MRGLQVRLPGYSRIAGLVITIDGDKLRDIVYFHTRRLSNQSYPYTGSAAHVHAHLRPEQRCVIMYKRLTTGSLPTDS